MSKNEALIVVLVIGLATVVGNCAAQEQIQVKMNIPEPGISINIPDDTVQLIVDASGDPGLFSRTIEGVSFGLDCYGGGNPIEIVASDLAEYSADTNGHMRKAIPDGMDQFLVNPLFIKLPEAESYESLTEDVYAIYDCGDYNSQTIGFQQQIVPIDPYGDYDISLSLDISPVFAVG
jgi:hypothetical protein